MRYALARGQEPVDRPLRLQLVPKGLTLEEEAQLSAYWVVPQAL